MERDVPALPHLSLAYCVRRSARIRRRVDGARTEVADLLPRRFGMIPSDRSSTWQVDGNPEVQLAYLRRDTIDELAIDEFDTDPARRAYRAASRLRRSGARASWSWRCSTPPARRMSPTSGLWADHVVRVIGLELLSRHSNVASRAIGESDLTRSRLPRRATYIEANLDADLSLASIAEAVGAGPQGWHAVPRPHRRAAASIRARAPRRPRSAPAATTDAPIAGSRSTAVRRPESPDDRLPSSCGIHRGTFPRAGSASHRDSAGRVSVRDLRNSSLYR